MGDDGIPTQTWWQGIVTSIKTQTSTWLVAFLIGILGLFSGRITESLKFSLNRADLRTKQYEQLATDVSSYIFSAELTTEYIEHNWTTKAALSDLIKEYNTSITTLRKNEFVYSAWIKKYWDKEELAKFDGFMVSVHKFDQAVHSLNDEFEKVNITKKEQKIDPKRAKEALAVLQPGAAKLREDGRGLLTALN